MAGTAAEVETQIEMSPGLPIANLPTICLGRLKDGSEAEARKLLEGSRNYGVFYLDLQTEDKLISPIIEVMYQLTRDLFDLPEEEKMLYDVDKLCAMKSNGYKPLGRNFGGLAGKKDGFETYAIPKDGLMGLDGQTDFLRPSVIDRNMDALGMFTHFIHSLTQTITESLSCSLKMAEHESLRLYHRLAFPSPDIVRLLKYQAQRIEERGTPHAAHTDLGSLTFLFTQQLGLQVLTESQEWEWVLPKKGHAIVNLGDAMSLLTNGYLKSCVHRVGPLPNQPMPTRYSFAYMVRPEYQTPMAGPQTMLIPSRDQDQRIFTSRDWLQQKYGVLRLDTRPINQDWVMTGQEKTDSKIEAQRPPFGTVVSV